MGVPGEVQTSGHMCPRPSPVQTEVVDHARKDRHRNGLICDHGFNFCVTRAASASESDNERMRTIGDACQLSVNGKKEPGLGQLVAEHFQVFT